MNKIHNSISDQQFWISLLIYIYREFGHLERINHKYYKLRDVEIRKKCEIYSELVFEISALQSW